MMRSTKHSLRHLLLLLTLVGMVGSALASATNNDIYGTWKIKALVGAAAVSGLSDRQVHRLIGKAVIIRAEKFVFNGRTCRHPTYKRSVEETVAYFDREWRADSSELPLPNPVTIIETECNMLYPFQKNHIIVAEDGNFFEAVRVGR